MGPIALFIRIYLNALISVIAPARFRHYLIIITKRTVYIYLACIVISTTHWPTDYIKNSLLYIPLINPFKTLNTSHKLFKYQVQLFDVVTYVMSRALFSY